jgi:hypothetical protein
MGPPVAAIAALAIKLAKVLEVGGLGLEVDPG